jgi:NhaA family Na+:H+ antiporter
MTQPLHPDLSADDHTRGDAASPIVVTVFGDYECPVSGRLWSVLRDLRGAREEIREAFRHFPLTGVHPHAFSAALAAEAAADQGRFWPMHDRLFEYREELDIADLASHAAGLGLDVERFDQDVAYETFAEVVRAHQRSGISSGVATTPAIFVNGRRFLFAKPEELLTELRP